MIEVYFDSAEQAASELGAPLLVAASSASAVPHAGRRLSEHAVESVLGAHLFHRMRLASPVLPQVLWVTAPQATLEHIGWAVGIAEHVASTGRLAYLAVLDGTHPLQGFASGAGLRLPRAVVSKLAAFGVGDAGGWTSDLQGVQLVLPTPGAPAGDPPDDPLRWMLVIARAMPEGFETTERYRAAADGVILVAAIRDHLRSELLAASRTLQGPGAPLIGVITMGPVPSGSLPTIERWERVLAGSEVKAPAVGANPPAAESTSPAPPPVPPSSPPASPPIIVADVSEGVRSGDEPVPLVASWRPEERRGGVLRVALWIAAVLVVTGAAYWFRADIGRFMTRGRPGAPPGEPPPLSLIERNPIDESAGRLITPPFVEDSTRPGTARTPPSQLGVPGPGPGPGPAPVPSGSIASPAAGPAPAPAWADTFVVHVGSFPQAPQAQTEAGRLRGLGVVPQIISVMIPERGVWYRVVVGAFPDSLTAGREAEHLREAGLIAFAQILRHGGRGATARVTGE